MTSRIPRHLRRAPAILAEVGGSTLIMLGPHEIYSPAALIFAGASLIFIAQGMERHG